MTQIDSFAVGDLVKVKDRWTLAYCSKLQKNKVYKITEVYDGYLTLSGLGDGRNYSYSFDVFELMKVPTPTPHSAQDRITDEHGFVWISNEIVKSTGEGGWRWIITNPETDIFTNSPGIQSFHPTSDTESKQLYAKDYPGLVLTSPQWHGSTYTSTFFPANSKPTGNFKWVLSE